MAASSCWKKVSCENDLMPKGDKWRQSNGKVGLCNEFQGFLEIKRTPADTVEDNCSFWRQFYDFESVKL